ncbi:efflux RND transporter periplasmic adaptor subunit [Caulobacter vibrioides]|uniref:efflux RND transporter periplasmic adaptor subunit n=1 Tax=Caulobacter vibrioides TaxID=155892 RepID=UPI000BB4F2A4|nr:efflux RND transporter periplasmic adaptor subunit [Caulobacter vibrioides]ATC23889.1 efflux RND transporter periplasmic adaptor subunit [Caulobacter vibrioides]AZH12126.1 efflux RND transporter periplasmic adaptor subunit [Caulobacter vibrioides]PLR15902.1 efflux RND transporter periplasmic adaptor subunit [Caulobacter vibrioides]
MMRATSRLVVFLAAAVLAVAVVAWFVMSRRPPEVAVLEIKPATIEQALSVVGRVRPLELVQVASPNSGQIVRLLHDEGDRVAAGDPLAVVLATVEQAQTQVDVARERAARAAAAEARLNYQRVKTLYDQGFAAKAALDAARAGLDTAQANVAAASAGVRASAERAQEFVIRAPMAGVVLFRPIDNGQVVSAGQTLFELGSSTGVEIRAEVEEVYADALRPGQVARAALSGSSTIFPARVTEVSPRVDSSTGGRSVRLAAEGEQDLSPGRSVDVTIVVRQRPGAIVIPRAAVLDATAAPKVHVVDAGDIVRARSITVARWPSVNAIVESGLRAGDRVVLEPAVVKPGAQVTPIAAKPDR